jgi:hypothetical protein
MYQTMKVFHDLFSAACISQREYQGNFSAAHWQRRLCIRACGVVGSAASDSLADDLPVF